jgi:hypothetical protein
VLVLRGQLQSRSTQHISNLLHVIDIFIDACQVQAMVEMLTCVPPLSRQRVPHPLLPVHLFVRAMLQ